MPYSGSHSLAICVAILKPGRRSSYIQCLILEMVLPVNHVPSLSISKSSVKLATLFVVIGIGFTCIRTLEFVFLVDLFCMIYVKINYMLILLFCFLLGMPDDV